MFKRLLIMAVRHFLVPDDESASAQSRKERPSVELSDWERFVYHTLRERILETGDTSARVSYEHVRERAKAAGAPFSGYGKIKDAYDSLMDKGLIEVRKEGVHNVVHLLKWARDPDT